MKTIRWLDLDSELVDWGGFIQASVRTLAQARVLVRQLAPLSLRAQALIYVGDEDCVVHVGHLEELHHIRCFIALGSSNNQRLPFDMFWELVHAGWLRLGCVGEDAPYLFPNGREKEKRNEVAEKGEK